jgi:hypothetical protein
VILLPNRSLQLAPEPLISAIYILKQVLRERITHAVLVQITIP